MPCTCRVQVVAPGWGWEGHVKRQGHAGGAPSIKQARRAPDVASAALRGIAACARRRTSKVLGPGILMGMSVTVTNRFGFCLTHTSGRASTPLARPRPTPEIRHRKGGRGFTLPRAHIASSTQTLISSRSGFSIYFARKVFQPCSGQTGRSGRRCPWPSSRGPRGSRRGRRTPER